MIADIVLAEDVPPDVEAELRSLFGDLGASVRVRSIPPRRATADLAWVALATVSLDAFARTLVGDVTRDAYGRLKALLGRLFQHDESGVSPLVLQDPVSRLRVVLEPDLPLAAYRRLTELDLSRFRHGPLHYDRHRSAWRSEVDEADRSRG